MRPKLNKFKWKVIRITIDISESKVSKIASSSSFQISRDNFFEETFELIQERGYYPRMPIERMRKLLKSPYSDSEYYVFLKLEDDTRIKVVLDIRIADHPLKEWGSHSARDRKLHHMQTEEVNRISQEDGLEIDPDINTVFYDVVETKGTFLTISIDGEVFLNYSDALEGMKARIASLP